jgi:hypothetical protein
LAVSKRWLYYTGDDWYSRQNKTRRGTAMAKKAVPVIAEFHPQPNTVAARILSGEIATPDALICKVDLRGWMVSLVTGAEYEEPDPDAMARNILMESLTIESMDQMWDDGTPQHLQDAIDNFPGATTGPVEIVDLIVTGSDYEEGSNTYMILTLVDLETRVAEKYSTGAVPLQSDVIRHLGLGIWPIRCQISRVVSKDKGGRHILKMFPVD